MIKSLLLVLLFPMACVMANKPTDYWQLSNPCKVSSIMQVVTKQAASIESFDGERLYLKSDNIVQSDSGYALYNGYSTILLPRLASDHMGYYLSCRSRDDVKLTCSNSQCGYVWWFTDEWTIYCPICGSIGN